MADESVQSNPEKPISLIIRPGLDLWLVTQRDRNALTSDRSRPSASAIGRDTRFGDLAFSHLMNSAC
jgi:hypothetical protein